MSNSQKIKIIEREDIKEPNYLEILKKESFHGHVIVSDEQGTIRWKENPIVRGLVDKINLNDLWILFHYMDIDKNNDHLRKLYRDMGYSLSGYWEIFYWEANNEDADKYRAESTN